MILWKIWVIKYKYRIAGVRTSPTWNGERSKRK